MGKPINDTILSREELTTKKHLTYRLEDIRTSLEKIRQVPQAVVVHVGTNNLDDTAEKLVNKIEGIMPNSKVIFSNLLVRGDNHQKVIKLQYVNAAINMKHESDHNVSCCMNDNINKTHLASDGVHLTEHGTARLANNIKYAVAKSLNVEVKKKRNIR